MNRGTLMKELNLRECLLWEWLFEVARITAQMNIAGEEGDVSPQTIDRSNEIVKERTKSYSPRDAWNEDETGCFWKAIPEK